MAIQSTLSKAAALLAEAAKKKLAEEIQQKVAPTIEKVEEKVSQVSEVLEKISPVLTSKKTAERIVRPRKDVVLKPEEPIVLKPEEPVVVKPARPVVARPKKPVVEKPEELVVVKPARPVVVRPKKPVVVEPEEPIVLKPEVLIPEVIIKPPIVKPPIPPVIDTPPTFSNVFDPQASMLKHLGRNINKATPNVSRVSCRKTNFGVKRFTNDLDKNTNMDNVINELLKDLDAPKKTE